jgi:hypothetical protein
MHHFPIVSWCQKCTNLVWLPKVLEVLSPEVEGIASKLYMQILLKVVDLPYGWVWSLHHLKMKKIHVWSCSSCNEIFTCTFQWIAEELAFCHVFFHVFCLHIFLVIVQGSKMDAWCWKVLAHLHMDMKDNNEFFFECNSKGNGQGWNRKGFFLMMYLVEMNIIVHIPNFETFSSFYQKKKKKHFCVYIVILNESLFCCIFKFG